MHARAAVERGVKWITDKETVDVEGQKRTGYVG